MNYDHNKTVDYPNLMKYENLENNPISLVNENNYKKPEINHLNSELVTKTIEKRTRHKTRVDKKAHKTAL